MFVEEALKAMEEVCPVCGKRDCTNESCLEVMAEALAIHEEELLCMIS